MEYRDLFKGKEKYSGKWLEWNAIAGIPHNVTILTNTICRCTGVKEKNGNLIWENDIAVCRDFTEEKYVIAWKQDEACFEYQQYGCSIMNFEQLSGCEVDVIGNIFDNPELLESEG